MSCCSRIDPTFIHASGRSLPLFLAGAFFFLLSLGRIEASPDPAPVDSAFEVSPELCLSPGEWELYRQMNLYRRNMGLPPIPLSASLTRVAQYHAQDLAEFRTDTGVCNMHSWSSNGEWSSCCYTSDHARAECMWDKPMEISGYSGEGYEISFWASNGSDYKEYPALALRSWIRSPGHHHVIVNRGKWADHKWKAVGVGIRNGYACMWFGTEPDASAPPARCLP